MPRRQHAPGTILYVYVLAPIYCGQTCLVAAFVCEDCPRAAFSKLQLKKKDGSQRKCRECVAKGDNKATVPPRQAMSNEKSGSGPNYRRDIGSETPKKYQKQVEHDNSASMNSDKMKAASSAAGIDSSSPNERARQ